MKTKLFCAYRRLFLVLLIFSCSLLVLVLQGATCFAAAETEQRRPLHNTSKNDPKLLFMSAAMHKFAITDKNDESGSSKNSELEQHYANEEPTDMKNVIFIENIISKNAGITEDRITDIPGTPSVIKLVEPPKKIHLDTLVEEKINAALQNSTKNKKHSTKKVLTDIGTQPSDSPPLLNEPVLEILPKDGGQSMFNTDPGGPDDPTVPSSKDNTTPEDSGAAATLAVEVELDKLLSTEMNLTAEEHPIPVFSEWAQKQLEEAEKKMEEEKVNSSTQKKSSASSQKTQNGKTQTSMKIRPKNYASPDCGAKIIATNPDAQSTGAVLTSHRDEYFLSPCTSRIWFVVELCEAIQAESIELANFELFSSSPRDFVVSVGARFPTRDWATVGQFTAKDERDVQSFHLYPHLFGKYVRVEINSHYNSEHYCPISLFRVYGTSEMEAFETENQPPSGGDGSEFEDDEDDEAKTAQGDRKKPNNLLKTAGEAVMNIVKKAAEALGKSGQNQTHNNHSTDLLSPEFLKRSCMSLAYDIVCPSCSTDQSIEIYSLLSCSMPTLSSLLDHLKSNLYKSQQCAKLLGFNLDVNTSDCQKNTDYFLESVMSQRHLVALCNLLAIEEKKIPLNSSCVTSASEIQHLDNQTIDSNAKDKKTGQSKNVSLAPADAANDIDKGKSAETREVKPAASQKGEGHAEPLKPSEDGGKGPGITITTTDASTIDPAEDIAENQPQHVIPEEVTTESVGDGKKATANQPEDVNIFNVLVDGRQDASAEAETDNKDHTVPEQMSRPDTAEATTKPETLPLTEEILTTSDDIRLPIATELPPLADTFTTEPPAMPPFSQHKNQPESVFLRLTNRIKSLERNMSLSGQYLEELSKRYKRQVEELQLSFAKTLQSIEAQNRKSSEREQLLMDQLDLLRQDLDALVTRIYNWKNILMYCGGFFLVQLIVLCLIARGCFGGKNRSQYVKQVVPNKSPERLIDRRNSVEGVMSVAGVVKNSPITTQPRRRRPSEEALNIVGHYENLLIVDSEGDADASKLKKLEDKRRRRKISNKSTKRAISEEMPVERVRKSGAKAALFRTDSAPANYENYSSGSSGMGGMAANGEGSSGSSFTNRIGDLPLLEDNDEFIIPGASDYSYNEFVPSNANVTSTPHNGETVSVSSIDSKQSSSTKLSKARRLSSPSFLKNALTRSSSRKSTNSQPSTESTGWKWNKLRKSSNATASNTSKVRKKSKSESPPTNGVTTLDTRAAGDGLNNNNNNSSASLSSDVVVNLGHSDSTKDNGNLRTTTPPPSPAKTTSLRSEKRGGSGGSFRKIFRKMF